MDPGAYKACPGLKPDNHKETSPWDAGYNCIAYAAGDSWRWWQPTRPGQLSPGPGRYWPPSAPKEVTVEAYAEAYRSIGYVDCDDGDHEQGFETVALYVKDGLPTHAARQIAHGRWTSKLGKAEDIEHDRAEDVAGGEYGRPTVFLKREVKSPVK